MISIDRPEKNKEYVLTIDAISSDGNGIGRIDGYTVFVPNSAIGDKLLVRVVKTNSNYGYGRIEKTIAPSKGRIEPPCQNHIQCGGCNLLHLSYENQLEIKKSLVENAISRIGGFQDFKVDEIIGMDRPFRYRNKMVFPFGNNQEGELCYGFFRQRSHNIIELSDCLLGDEINIRILNSVKDYMLKNEISAYNEENHTGTVRRVFIRKSHHTGEIMVVISANSKSLPNSSLLVNSLLKLDDNISSIFLNINTQKNNLVLTDKNVLLYGKPVICDSILGFEYEISPNSFFQVNPIQTEKLYQKAIEYARISEKDNVIDIYCGIGTISLCAAKYAKKVCGIEIVPQAIADAKKNAILNEVENAGFYAGDAQVVVPKLISDGFTPDIAILDPPRKGSDKNTLSAIVSANPKRIVYVSCNPSTLARDMKYLAEFGYKPEKCTAVDMFPHTTHVECVVLLCKKKNKQ